MIVVLCMDVMTTLGKICSVRLHAYPSSVQLDTVTYTGGSVHISLTTCLAETALASAVRDGRAWVQRRGETITLR